jgi:hypothetical protein
MFERLALFQSVPKTVGTAKRREKSEERAPRVAKYVGVLQLVLHCPLDLIVMT